MQLNRPRQPEAPPRRGFRVPRYFKQQRQGSSPRRRVDLAAHGAEDRPTVTADVGDVAYGIFGLLLLGTFGWAIVGILRRIANGVGRRGGTGQLGAQLRHGSPDQRRAQADRRLQPFEERLVSRLGVVAQSRSVLLADDGFLEAVDELEQLQLPADVLIAIALDEERPWASRIALAALARREGTPAQWPP